MVSEELSSKEDLDEWIEKILEEYGDNFKQRQACKLYEAIYRFLTNKHKRISNDTETIDYYKRQYVFSLMDNGLDAKRGGGAMLSSAERYLERAISIIKENPLASFRLGILNNSEDRAKAIGFFARALVLSRSNFGVLEKLKLNTSQVDYAIEQVSTLFREINGESESRFKTRILTNEVLRQEIEERVIYSSKNCSELATPVKQISTEEYDDLLMKLKNDSDALVIDRFNPERPYISYMKSGAKYLSEDDSKLKYLLSSLDLVEYPDPLGKIAAYRQNASRLNRDLMEIGVLPGTFKISTSGSGRKRIFAISNLEVHYFRTIVH